MHYKLDVLCWLYLFKTCVLSPRPMHNAVLLTCELARIDLCMCSNIAICVRACSILLATLAHQFGLVHVEICGHISFRLLLYHQKQEKMFGTASIPNEQLRCPEMSMESSQIQCIPPQNLEFLFNMCNGHCTCIRPLLWWWWWCIREILIVVFRSKSSNMQYVVQFGGTESA